MKDPYSWTGAWIYFISSSKCHSCKGNGIIKWVFFIGLKPKHNLWLKKFKKSYHHYISSIQLHLIIVLAFFFGGVTILLDGILVKCCIYLISLGFYYVGGNSSSISPIIYWILANLSYLLSVFLLLMIFLISLSLLR